MSPDHIVLQTISCHERVNVGNFNSDLIHSVMELHERGDVMFMIDDRNEKWTLLTSAGRVKLLALNAELPPQFSIEEIQTAVSSA